MLTLSSSLVDPQRSSGRAERTLRNIRWPTDHSDFAPENLTTLPHFSVSSAMSLPKPATEPGSTMPPRSANRAFNLGSASPALISLLSLLMMSDAVFLGALRQTHW